MQRLTLLALLAPFVLPFGPARAEPAEPTPAPAAPDAPAAWPAEGPTPEGGPATEVPVSAPPAPGEAPFPAPAPAPAPPPAEPAQPMPPEWSPAGEPGATAPPVLPAPEASYALYATREPAASALYLQGFDVSWEARPHRLRSLVFVADASAPSADTPPSGALLARVQGGSWASGARASDTALASLAYGGLSSTRAPLYRGAVRTSVKGTSAGAEAAAATIPVEVPIPGVEADGAAVFLQGFAVVSDAAHPDGYTPHVLAVRLGPATVRDGVARFDVTVELQAASVPDRDQHLADYGAEIEVGWMLVPAAAARVHRLEASGGATHGIEIGANVAHALPVPLEVGVDLLPNTTEVATGLSGFRVAIDSTGITAGRYLRNLGVTLVPGDVDPWRARWDGTVEARFSNVGQLTRPEGVALQADVTVLELTEGERAWSGRWDTPLQGADQQMAYPGAQRELGTQ